jgi:tetratricopeptide (TPR) repeat protein
MTLHSIPFRAYACALSVALFIGASLAIKTLDGEAPPDTLALEALRPSNEAANPDIQGSIRLYTEALRRDVANPYRWSDLAAACQADNDLQCARACHQRALELSGEVPQIWLRAANFHFDQDEFARAIPLAARVLKTVPNYDEVLFSYFDRLLSDPAPVYLAIATNRRAVRAYVSHLITIGNMKAARQCWRFAQGLKFTDDAVTASYLDGMLHARRFADAQNDWVAYLGPGCGDYPSRNRLFNAGFERAPTGSPLDWRIELSDKFETARDDAVSHSGKWSLKIRFDGAENVSYANLSQLAWVTPGRYAISAWVRADEITTNEGIYLEVSDAEIRGRSMVRTDPVSGTAGWRLIEKSFVVESKTNLLSIRVVRDPSRKFDNKISGTVWLDDVVLSRL